MMPMFDENLLAALMRKKRTFLGDDEPPQFGYEDMLAPEPEPDLPGPERRKGGGKFDALKRMIPDLIDSSLAAVGTPNIAMGGPVDIARGAMAGRNATRMNEALARSNRQQDAEMESALDLRRRQAATADAELERAKRPPARYINLGGGAYLDNTTGQVSDASSIKRQAERTEREQIALRRGLTPGSPVYNVFVDEGKYPEGYGKPPATKPAGKETPEQQQQRWQAEADRWFKPGSEEHRHHALYGKPYTPPKQPAPMSPYQQERLDIEKEKRDEARDDKRAKVLQEIEAEETGTGGKPGLHAQREEAGREIAAVRNVRKDKGEQVDAVALRIAADKMNAANRRLRALFKRKMQLGAIRPEEYQRLLVQFQDYKPVIPAKPAANGPAQPSRPPLENFRR